MVKTSQILSHFIMDEYFLEIWAGRTWAKIFHQKMALYLFVTNVNVHI